MVLNAHLHYKKRFFVYQLHGAKVSIQNTPKNIMFSFLLIFLTILVPKWNALVGWESSILYFPNITKIYISSLIVLFFFIIFLNRAWRTYYQKSIVGYSIRITAFLLSFMVVFSWNEVIAGWVEDSIWYVPHITKIFISLSLAGSILYRGPYFPLNNDISLSTLLPFNWIKAGLLGLSIDLVKDLVKSPGFILGAMLRLITSKRH